MSYSQSYNAYIPYSGSVSYRYPASEHGGSDVAYYNIDVPVNVTINVDTEPFDGSVKRFNTSIGALGASVTAMHAAQCAAILKSAEEVSASVINGFFGMINTELSQQIQALDSAIKAGFGLITEQGKAVSEIKNVMEEDYNRISSRYIKLFSDLDNECYKRIFALDKQSFTLSEKVQKQLLCESSSDAAAMNLLGTEEVSSSKTLVFISSLNRKALEVLKTLHDYITQESMINALINSLLLNEEIDKNATFYIPVIWSESDMTEGVSVEQECFVSDHIDQQRKQMIAEKVKMFCSSSSSSWKDSGKLEKEALNREFNSITESYFSDTSDEKEQRIYRTMLSLWQNTRLSSL
jgi:hypothetical protein